MEGARQHYMQNHSAMMMMALKDGDSAKQVIGTIVRNEVFRMIKFIVEDEQLAYDGQIAGYVAAKMDIEPENRQFRQLWRAQKKNVKKTLDSKRSTSSMAVKRVVIRKYCAAGELVYYNCEGHETHLTQIPHSLQQVYTGKERCVSLVSSSK